MPLSEAGRREGPTPGLLFALALLAAMMAGMLLVIRAGAVAAQSENTPPHLRGHDSDLAPIVPLPISNPQVLAAPAQAAMDDVAHPAGMQDDLPPAIRKARPSGMVPADLPGRSQRDCAILRSVQVYQGIGRRTDVAVSPADLPGVTPDGPCPSEE